MSIKRANANDFEVELREDPPERIYTVIADGNSASFMLSGVYFGELHSSVQGGYIATIRKAMLAHGIKLHGPTLAHYLKNVGR